MLEFIVNEEKVIKIKGNENSWYILNEEQLKELWDCQCIDIFGLKDTVLWSLLAGFSLKDTLKDIKDNKYKVVILFKDINKAYDYIQERIKENTPPESEETINVAILDYCTGALRVVGLQANTETLEDAVRDYCTEYSIRWEDIYWMSLKAMFIEMEEDL